MLCLLEQLSLTTYTVDGETLTMSLPQPFTRLWPLSSGLLLTVRLRLLAVRPLS